MEDTFLFKKIRTVSRNGVIFFGFFAVLILSLLGFMWMPFYNTIYGPFPMDETSLASIIDIQKNNQKFVRVSGTGKRVLDLENLSYTVSHRSYAQTRTVHYILLQVGKHFLLTRIQDPNLFEKPINKAFTGELRPLGRYQKKKESTSVTETNSPILHNQSVVEFLPTSIPTENVLPYELDTTKSYPIDLFVSGGVGLFLFGVLLAVVIFHFRIYLNPKRHAVFQSLSINEDPEKRAAQVDAELSQSNIQKMGPAWITHSFLIWSSRFILFVLPLDSLVGVSVVTKMTTLAKIGRQNISFYFYLQNQKTIQLWVPFPYAEEIIKFLQKRTPWITLVKEPSLSKRWKQEKDKVIAEVLERKKQIS